MKDQDKSKDTRRKFLQSASVILLACGFKMKNRKTETEDRNDFKALNENSNFDIGDRGEEIIKKAADLGYKYEDKYRGCARCTVAALQDAIDFIPEDADLFRTASCLDGGATPSKIANCGAFTGSGMVIGWLCGTGRFGDNKLSHELIHEVYDRFKKEYGTVVCKEIREKVSEKCPMVVANAAKWTTEILLQKFTNYSDTK